LSSHVKINTWIDVVNGGLAQVVVYELRRNMP